MLDEEHGKNEILESTFSRFYLLATKQNPKDIMWGNLIIRNSHDALMTSNTGFGLPGRKSKKKNAKKKHTMAWAGRKNLTKMEAKNLGTQLKEGILGGFP